MKRRTFAVIMAALVAVMSFMLPEPGQAEGYGKQEGCVSYQLSRWAG